MFKNCEYPECGVEIVDIESEEKFEQLMLEVYTMWLNDSYDRGI